MKVLSFGEMLLRLKPPATDRILQTNSFDAAYGGAEANTAASLALLGNDVTYVTKLPANLIGDAALSSLRRHGVKTEQIIRGGERLGLYFFEKGASIRSTNVVYDRKYSAFSQAKAAEFNWQELLKDVDVFYFSGVTPAASDELKQTLIEACSYCRDNDIEVVCDLNYRGKMWSPEEAQAYMKKVMEYVTVCLAHDEDFEAALGISPFDPNEPIGLNQKEAYKQGMKEVTERYPNCHTVVSVVRNIYSVEDSEWGALLYKNGEFYEADAYKVHVMEGVAAGDAFGAGYVHAMLHQYEPQEALEFSLAASVLKVTIAGDTNFVYEDEIRSVMDGAAGAKLKR